MLFHAQIKYSEELKLDVVKYIMDGHSQNEAKDRFYVDKGSIQKWYNAYQQYGAEGITIKQANHRKYTGDFKISVVEYKRDKQVSARQAAAYFNIPSYNTIILWEKLYLKKGAEALLRENRGRARLGNGVMKGRKRKLKEHTADENLTNKSLLEENNRLSMENEYLKKLNALIQEQEEQKKLKK